MNRLFYVSRLSVVSIWFVLSVSLQALADAPLSKMSHTLTITGLVGQPLVLTPGDLAQFSTTVQKAVPLVCMTGQRKGTLLDAQGVSLKTLLVKAGIQVESPKDFRKLAIVASATDDYWVTFSWGEIFNRDDGDSVIVFYQQDGQRLGKARGRFNLVPTHDKHTGGREVKWLEKIIVKLIEQEGGV